MLSATAKKFLCICATSVSSERSFSTGGNIVTSKRNSLKPHVSQKLKLVMNTFIRLFVTLHLCITYHSIISIMIIFIVSNDVFHMLHVIIMYYMQCSYSLEVEETSPAIIYNHCTIVIVTCIAVLLISYREPFFGYRPALLVIIFQR